MLRSLLAITMVSGANSHTCVQQACTTHCNVTSNDCCEPNTCQFDPVFNDARCIPPSPMICGVDGLELPSFDTCIDKACTTHCDVTSNNCCEPNTCQFDPVFNDARCIPPSPMICGVGAIPDSMNAFAAVAGSDSAEYQTVPTPQVGDLRKTFSKLPANDTCEVMIQVHASSVNPSDVSPATSRDNASAVVPLGSDVAGVVVATEDSCSRISVGDSVWGDIGAVAFTSEGTKTKELGAYAEYAVALESQIAVVPTGMSLQEAGSLPKVALTSYKALAWFAGAPWSDASNAAVLVLGGSGGTGTTGVQLAKHFGAAKIIATCGTDNVGYCASNGADQVIDYHTQDWWTVLDDDSLHVVYDTVGESGTAERAMQKLAAGGYFVTIAGALAPQPKPGVKQASFINSDTNLASAPLLESLTDIANNGALRMPRLFATFGLDKVSEGFDLSKQGHVVGKVSILVNNATAV